MSKTINRITPEWRFAYDNKHWTGIGLTSLERDRAELESLRRAIAEMEAYFAQDDADPEIVDHFEGFVKDAKRAIEEAKLAWASIGEELEPIEKFEAKSGDTPQL